MELTELVEKSLMTWIQATSIHGQNCGIVPRHYRSIKFEDDGSLDPLQLPAVIVQAVQGRMVNTNVAVWMFDCAVTLVMQADDSNQAAWDISATALELILSEYDLASVMTAGTAGFLCRGVVSRNAGQTQVDERHWTRQFQVQLWASRDTP